ncbi:MAG: rhodanese-like domain-containing protein [Bdellovibrionota bacterium]
MANISIAEFCERMQKEPGLLLDVRTPAEFEEFHLTGATNIPLDRFSADAVLHQNNGAQNKPVYLLCRSGARAAKAATLLEHAGWRSVFCVDGGSVACRDAGLPVETSGRKPVMSLERQVRIAAGSLVLLGVLGSLLVSPVCIGLSAFVGAGLVFAGITDWCGMGLLLARMPWNTRRTCE